MYNIVKKINKNAQLTVVLIYPCDPHTTITPNNRGFTLLLKSDDYDFQKYGHKIFIYF